MDATTRQRLEIILKGFDEGSVSGPGGCWVSSPLDFECIGLVTEIMAALDGALPPEETVKNIRTKVFSIRERFAKRALGRIESALFDLDEGAR